MKEISFLILVAVLSPPIFSQEPNSALLARIEEIKNYSSAEGIWEGVYHVKHAPEELLETMEDDGSLLSGYGIRLDLKNSENPSLYLKFDSNSSWEKISGEAYYFPDQFGWQFLLDRNSGFWVERYIISVERTAEFKANISFTRTVHNWYIEQGHEYVPRYYSVFGVGEIEKHNK